MMKKLAVVLITLSTIALRVSGQTTEPDQRRPTTSPTDAPAQVSSPPPEPPRVVNRPVSWKLLLPHLMSDQERIWSFPAKLGRSENWIPTAAVLGTTAGLLALDPIDAAYFRRTQTFQPFNRIFSGNASAIGTVATPITLYAVGFIKKDSKMQRTALFAGEAFANSEFLTTVLKNATRRVRPAAISAKGNLSDTWFEPGGSSLRGAGSFPSGHSIAAFSIATVIARCYGNHRWVPYVAYSMAALVGFSRLSLSAHFLSDVFMGGALGYSISRFAVLR